MTQRKRPTPPQNRPSPNATNGFHEFTAAVRCARCRQWLVAPASVRRHLGPVCAAKVVAE